MRSPRCGRTRLARRGGANRIAGRRRAPRRRAGAWSSWLMRSSCCGDVLSPRGIDPTSPRKSRKMTSSAGRLGHGAPPQKTCPVAHRARRERREQLEHRAHLLGHRARQSLDDRPRQLATSTPISRARIATNTRCREKGPATIRATGASFAPGPPSLPHSVALAEHPRHHAGHDHDRAEVHAPPQEPQRGRRRPLAAAFFATAEAESRRTTRPRLRSGRRAACGRSRCGGAGHRTARQPPSATTA